MGNSVVRNIYKSSEVSTVRGRRNSLPFMASSIQDVDRFLTHSSVLMVDRFLTHALWDESKVKRASNGRFAKKAGRTGTNGRLGAPQRKTPKYFDRDDPTSEYYISPEEWEEVARMPRYFDRDDPTSEYYMSPEDWDFYMNNFPVYFDRDDPTSEIYITPEQYEAMRKKNRV